MSKKKPLLVMYAMSYYDRWLDGVVNRNFHIVNELEKQNIFSHILFIDLLPYNVRSLMRSIKFGRKIKKRNIEANAIGGGNLFTLPGNRSLFTPGVTYGMGAHRFITAYIMKLVTYLAKNTTSVSWSYNPLDLTFLNKDIFSKTIFEAVDDWRYHTAYEKLQKKINSNYKRIADHVDVLFSVSNYVSQMFIDEFKRPNTEITLIPNTSELVFVKPIRKKMTENVIYLGTIESRFDMELVDLLIKKNPKKHFTFVGPIWKAQKKQFMKLIMYSNTTYKGELPFLGSVADVLARHDVGIIPHRVTKFSLSNDPLKLYDYLQAGLPVVTTIPSSEPTIQEFIYTAMDANSFNSALTRALHENSPELVKNRVAAMQKLTWKSRVTTMLAKINL